MDYMTWSDFIAIMMLFLALAKFILESYDNNKKR